MSNRFRLMFLIPLLAIAVAALFFFHAPIARGTYQATHGPTTTMRALVQAALLLLSMLLAWIALLPYRAPLAYRLRISEFLDFASSSDFSDLSSAQLRC